MKSYINLILIAFFLLYQPFVPPPHFRRWMQRFMKRWHNRNAPGWEGAPCDKKEDKKEAEKEEKMEEENQESGESSGEEYLRNVGETVAQMLDPFGKCRILKYLYSTSVV